MGMKIKAPMFHMMGQIYRTSPDRTDLGSFLDLSLHPCYGGIRLLAPSGTLHGSPLDHTVIVSLTPIQTPKWLSLSTGQ